MTLVSSSRLLLLCLSLAAVSLAQEPPAHPAPPPSEAPPPPEVIHTPKPPQEPAILEDGGFSIQPIYWFSKAQPTLRGGKVATTFESLDYPGNSNRPLGGEIGIPTGHSNTLRVSYFRVQGNANSTATRDVALFGEGFSAGDYLSANYLIQSAKISWDYLSYNWHKPSTTIRLKTLYELQYVNVGTNVSAPFKAVTTDASGNVDTNTAAGTKTLFYPTVGMALGSEFGHHFRWEIRGSGFGLPHRGNIWDAQATIAFRVGPVEILGGEKAYHFKTSPQSEQYFTQTLQGAYVGIRYYWGQQ
jgi:hypothetical protein